MKRGLKAVTWGQGQTEAKAKSGVKKEDIGIKDGEKQQNQAKAKDGIKKEGMVEDEGSGGKQNQAKTNGAIKNEDIGAKNPKGKDIQVKRDIKAKTGGEEQNQVNPRSGVKKGGHKRQTEQGQGQGRRQEGGHR